MALTNVTPTEATSSHPTPTPFSKHSRLSGRTSARELFAREATALPHYKALAEADTHEREAWGRWTEARATLEAASGDSERQVATAGCASAWEELIDAEARSTAASVAWRRAYRALPAYDDLLIATALSSLTATSRGRLAA